MTAPMARSARIPLCLLATASAVLLALPTAAGARTPSQLEREGVREIIVKRRRGLDREARAELRADADVRLEKTLRLPATEIVRADPGELTEALDALDRNPDVVYAEPNGRVRAATADTWWSELWGLDNGGRAILGQTGTIDADIDAPEAWALGTTGAAQTVAVVDSGVNAAHPDLTGQMATNPGESGAGRETNGIDDDHNGLADDHRGWDWVADDNDPDDGNRHGSHVAGTIAARRDTQGIVGVAPDARVLALRVLGADGWGWLSDIAEAFDYAGDLGVPIVNASLGGTSYSKSMLDAIVAHPNTLYVVAAGNSSVSNDSSPHYPCALGPTNVVCVGATDNRDARASFSNWGATTVDLFAPGDDVLSANKAGAADPWIYLSGTSMATPHVAGALALMRAAAPTLDAAQLKAALLSGVDALAALNGRAVTGGRLNAAAAVADAGIAAGRPAPPGDSDVDGFADGVDNCPAQYNPSQADSDGDGTGNACDVTPYGPDADGDTVPDAADNCPSAANPTQRDSDGDGAGNACDSTPYGPDPDGDGRGTLIDNCPTTYNPDQADRDRDRIGDACDPPPAPEAPDEPVTPQRPVGTPILKVIAVPGNPIVIVCRGHGGCRPRPLTLTFRLDRTAKVTARLQRRRCAGGACKYVAAQTLAARAHAGANRLIIGVGATARLKAGSYRVVLSARAAGRRSVAAVRAFRVR
jgi:subtilisin family serine protease